VIPKDECQALCILTIRLVFLYRYSQLPILKA
jgi:hypothetical protein